MLALRFDGQAPRLETVSPPTPKRGEARLRMLRAGICSTDLHIINGYMGFAGTLGHEVVAEVLEHPDESWVGARVTAEINLACGECTRCREGLGRHCETRTVLGILGKDGVFQEELTLPVANLHRVPDGLSTELATFAEPLAAAFEILEQVHVRPNTRVAVLGDGKLGSLCALVLAGTGAHVSVIGRHPAKLARLEAHVETHLDTDALSSGFPLVVEATGTAAGFECARSLVAPRGTLVLKSTFHGVSEIATAPFVIDEIALVGSRCGPFPPALRALHRGVIDPSPLIEAEYPLSDGLRALEHAGTRGTAKIQLVPDGR
ncbi:MAG: alcohol dehydrogenase catalytic domain-containing protein [Sandaracinaceae bacterium]